MVYSHPKPEGQMTRSSVPGDTIPPFPPVPAVVDLLDRPLGIAR